MHQDWTPVVFRKKTTPPPPTRHQTPKEIDLETTRIKRYSSSFASSVSQARNSKNLTRAQLAATCNVIPSIITDIENKTGIYDPSIANRVCSALGISAIKERWT